MSNFAMNKNEDIMILLYGIPTLVAQGLIFVGFIYLMAYVINGIESLVKKDKQRMRSSNESKNKKNISDKSSTQVWPTQTSNVSNKPIYKILLEINSDLARMGKQNSYVLLEITSIRVEDHEVQLREIYNANYDTAINEFGHIEENIKTYWLLEVEDCSFDVSKLQFICISKDEVCDSLSIYSASEIFYENKSYKLKRIEDLQRLDGYKSAINFDNWINTSGFNKKLSIIETASKRVMGNR